MAPHTLSLNSARELRDVLFSAMTDGVLIVNRQGVIVDCNPAFHQRLGYAKDELVGRPVSALDPPEFAAKVPERIALILQKGQATFETAHYRKDGSVMPVELNARLFEADGKSYIFSIVRDIADRKELEAKLQKSFDIYEAAINTPALGFWVVDGQGRFLEVNDAYVMQSGYSRDELLTMRIPDIEAMEKPEETASHIEKLKRDGYDRFQTAHRRKNGTVWPAEIVTTFSPLHGGLLIVFIEDITERKRIEDELRLAHDQLESRVQERTRELSAEIAMRREKEAELRKLSRAVEHSAHMIFITDVNGVIEYINPKFTEWLGYTPAEAIGRKPNLIQSGETPNEIYDDLWRTILSGNEWRGELKDRRKNGEVFWASVAIAPVRDDANRITHFVAVHEDVTQRKETEQAMLEARRAAELANKAKTDLMANMSHELRTPLNAIIGFSEAMRHGIFGPLGNAHYQEYIEFIHASGSHLLQLINDILDVSAVEAGKLELHEEEVNIAEICETAIRILQPKAQESSITLSGITGANIPALRGDPLRLKQIFINLISNAVKFTPEHGTVSCDAYIDGGNDMVITVTDTGIGMDEKGIEKALSKFGQVDSSLSRKHEGTGLGLPLTMGLVELHGGMMELASTPGAGTKITMRFPADRVVFPRG